MYKADDSTISMGRLRVVPGDPSPAGKNLTYREITASPSITSSSINEDGGVSEERCYMNEQLLAEVFYDAVVPGIDTQPTGANGSRLQPWSWWTNDKEVINHLKSNVTSYLSQVQNVEDQITHEAGEVGTGTYKVTVISDGTRYATYTSSGASDVIPQAIPRLIERGMQINPQSIASQCQRFIDTIAHEPRDVPI